MSATGANSVIYGKYDAYLAAFYTAILLIGVLLFFAKGNM